jgi:hypothetical protein
MYFVCLLAWSHRARPSEKGWGQVLSLSLLARSWGKIHEMAVISIISDYGTDYCSVHVSSETLCSTFIYQYHEVQIFVLSTIVS